MNESLLCRMAERKLSTIELEFKSLLNKMQTAKLSDTDRNRLKEIYTYLVSRMGGLI